MSTRPENAPAVTADIAAFPTQRASCVEVAVILQACADVCNGLRRIDLRGPSLTPLSADTGINWHLLVELAARTSVLPVLAERLDPAALLMPDWVRNLLERAREGSLLRNRVLLASALDISAGLARRSVSCAFRKGPHLCSLYSSVTARPFSDLDIYVRRAEMSAALAVLDELGFEPYLSRTEQVFLSMATETSTSWVRRTDVADVYVDVATQVGLPRMTRTAETTGREVLEAMLARGEVSSLGIPVLAPQDLLIDILVNFYVANTTLRNIWDGRHRRLRAYTDILVADGVCPPGAADQIAATLDAASLGVIGSYARQSLAGVFPEASVTSLDLAADLEVDDHLRVGHLDLPEPYLWTEHHIDRVFASQLPPGMPSSATPL